DPQWGHRQFGVPSPLHPGEAAGGLRALPGAAQHGQHLLVPQSGCAVPGVRGAPAEAAGPGPAGQRWVAPSLPPQPCPLAGLSSRVPPRHPLLLRGQQLHGVGPPLPALRAPPLPHPGHQPRLQLWDRRWVWDGNPQDWDWGLSSAPTSPPPRFHCRLRLWRSLPLARPWFFRGDFRQEGEN
ncbi:hypothetical protein Nmel_014334, partial [Mimus melanotis]